MIRVIPSISLSKGRLAKLDYGSGKNAQLYEQSPLDLAKYFEDHGAEWIHVVDLDGASEQEVRNSHVLQMLAGHTSLKINFSGGIRTDGGVTMAIENGAKTVTVATVAVLEPNRLMDWIITFGRNRLVLGADSSDGKIVTRGTNKAPNLDVWDFISYYRDRSLQYVKLTDVNRDGHLEGPNFELYEEAVRRFPDMHIVASGGVRDVKDIERLQDMGLWGVIVARAFYEDKIDIDDLKPFFNQDVAQLQ